MEFPEELANRFDSVEPLAEQGAFGRVYRCVRGRTVTVVKCLAPESLGGNPDNESFDRFRREITALAGIDHPNVVRILDSQVDTEPYWYEMEFAECGDLEGRIHELSHNLIAVRGIFRQICAGVKCLHELEPPIIHRDLKPRNVLLFLGDELQGYEGKSDYIAKIADLGHARIEVAQENRLTRRSSPIGTDLYMSPQQQEDPRSVDTSDDIYALGMMLIELCTGAPYPTLLDEVPEPLRQLARKMIAHSSSARYRSVAEVLEAIRDIETAALFEHGPPPPEFRFDFLVKFLSAPAEPSEWDRRLGQLEAVFTVAEGDPMRYVSYAVRLSDALIKEIGARSPGVIRAIARRFVTASERLRRRGDGGDSAHEWSKFLSCVYRGVRDEGCRQACMDGLLAISIGAGDSTARRVLLDLLRDLIAANDTAIAQKAIVASAFRDELAEVIEDLIVEDDLPAEARTLLGV